MQTTATGSHWHALATDVLAGRPITRDEAGAVLASADTLDLTFAGTGASFTAGKLRVYAIMMDVSSQGDTSANEVDRDTLA